MLLSAQLTNTIKSGAACVSIHRAEGTFDKQNWPFLEVLEHFDDLRRALVVPDGLLQQLLAVSSTAIMQPRDYLKTKR